MDSVRPVRWCMICDTALVTCKHYININSTKTSRSGLQKSFKDIFGDFSTNKSQHACDKCVKKVINVHSMRSQQVELISSYERTLQNHTVIASSSSSSPSTPKRKATTPKSKKGSNSENKREACFSPGTPSTKHVTKRLHGSSGTPKSKTRINFQPLTDNESSIGPVPQRGKQVQVNSQYDFFKDAFLQQIRDEVDVLCKPANKSAFRESSLSDLKNFNIKQQATELKSKAPTLLSVLEAATETPRRDRNVEKTKESVLPRVVSAASVLLNTRSQNMNAHQVLNSLTLKAGCSKKSTFSRMQSKGLCASYTTTLIKQVECGSNFDDEVKKWAEEAHQNNEKEKELAKEGGEMVEIYNRSRTDKGYTLVMDNVDMVVHARHPTRDNYGKDYHMVQMIAYQNRVTAFHLSNAPPTRSVDSVDSLEFLPTAQENLILRRDWMILAARMISQHIPALKEMMNVFPSEITHEHMAEMSKKSKVVNLGVLNENENTTDGILKIMHHMHQYVPGHSSEQPTTIISAGDLLTCERESNCIEEQRNSSTPSQRLEGLMPVIADFHALANFYQVIWKSLYDASSAADKGTLYSARNYLEARGVTTNPMKNINAAADLIEKYATALVLAAAMDYFGLDSLDAEPTKHTFNLEEHHDFKQYAEKEMESFICHYMIPSSEEVKLDEQSWVCSDCNKKYATRKGLVNHGKRAHSGMKAASASACGPQHQGNHDGVLNYSRCALGMCMVALDFNDARQMGDGGRIIRLYKILLLHCKAAQKPKYSFNILRLLAQVQCFLSPRLSYELVWNRFINTKGKAKCNVEPDRVLEHHNGVFKEQAHGFRGKITQKSVDRVSRSAQAVNSVLTNVDRQLEVKRPSAKRQSTGANDVASLAVELHQEQLFRECPGRRHSAFPNFPVTLLGTLEVPDLHRWISTTLRTLSRQNQFASH
eukprot:XP_011673174.1 PREDICTED: uncharacterized protein LOC105442605 [Strongylocentrotus purpuratus]